MSTLNKNLKREWYFFILFYPLTNFNNYSTNSIITIRRGFYEKGD
nr:MAG TPA: hypothetical protein [Caudoviricetes sp.]